MPPSLRSVLSSVAQLAVVGAAVVAPVAALLGWGWLVALLVLVQVVLAPVSPGPAAEDTVARLVRIAELGPSARLPIAFLSVLALSVRDAGPTGGAGVVVVVTGVAFVALHSVVLVSVLRYRVRRRLPIETRNVDLSALEVPPAPARRWSDAASHGIAASAAVVLVPACFTDDARLLAALAAVGWLLAAALTLPAVVMDLRTIGRVSPVAVIRHLNRFLDHHAPEVVLYFSDNETAAYQVNMWLASVERLQRPAVVLLRSRTALSALGPTRLPVLCVPAAVHLLALGLDTARVALFVANNGPNVHLLRLPQIGSAFIGHGDSDKSASVNPFAKAYDELWTAGPAARDRWRDAHVGIDLERVVEVGRPQLDVLVRATADAPSGDGADQHVPTLLYAPTWEGWNDSQAYGSVAVQGVALVEAVLASPVPLRLVYKPHPLTGRRDPAVLRAHRRIVRLVAEANLAQGAASAPVWEPPVVDPLREVTDSTERAVLSGQPLNQVSAVDAEARTRSAGLGYLRSLDPRAHLVVEGPGPELLAYFEVADFLVTDVSSVLTDFVATGRPFATCSTSGVGRDDFHRLSPATAGGIVVARDGTGIDEVVAVASGCAPDLYTEQRALLGPSLLGDLSEPAQGRFDRAVSSLARRADERTDARRAARGPQSEEAPGALLVSPDVEEGSGP